MKTDLEKFKELVTMLIGNTEKRIKAEAPKRKAGRPKGSKNKPKISKYGLSALKKIKKNKRSK
jgi:hypothetical protein